MRELTAKDLERLLTPTAPPCLSLYMPTERPHPNVLQNPVRYRNLLRTLEESLSQQHEARDIKRLLEPFHALAGDPVFWQHPLDGLAVFGCRAFFEVFQLQRAVPELAIVANSFHTKPLLRVSQSADRFQVLCLATGGVNLHEGNRYHLDPVDLIEVPSTLTEALGQEITEKHLQYRTHTLTPGPSRTPGGGTAMFHGQGGRKEEADIDRERYFRVVDRRLWEYHSEPTGLPLILVALPENQSLFRAISHNPHLLSEGISKDPAALDADDLRQAAWNAFEPTYRQRLERMKDDYHTARARNAASDNIDEVAEAASRGAVGILLVEADRQVPGRIDPQTGKVQRDDLSDPATDDLLDDAAEYVLRTKGTVVVVPREQMPTETGLAAIYRY